MADFVSEFKKNIFNITQTSFEKDALDVFHYQREKCKVYKNFISNLSKDYSAIKSIEEIPFLPIELFKSNKVISSPKEPKVCFESSGTTGQITSKHYVADLNFYKNTALKAFEDQFGSIKDYVVLALLPNYMERKNSSLVYMVQHFIDESKNDNSDFYLNNIDALKTQLAKCKAGNTKVLLIGVSFALLDLADEIGFPLNDNFIVMETGGMKGRRKELIRSELHYILKKRFGVSQIYSEYGMTELLSQAYLKDDNLFHTPNWMKFLVSDTEDPFNLNFEGRGVLNVIDLANIDSCSFIQLQDAGRLNLEGTFEVLGRIDNTDIRGCNLMYL